MPDLTVTPGKRGQLAYARGYQAAQMGEPETANPYQRMSLSRGGLGMAAWWATGHADYVQGRAQRYGARVAVYQPCGAGLPERVI